jgi:uncharacterized protein YmfQ (DUF2313 family)
MAVNNDAAYCSLLSQLMPLGPAWSSDIHPEWARLHKGLAAEFARVDSRGNALLLEMNPLTIRELIPDWEKVCDLPDGCLMLAASTLEQRRAAILGKVLGVGGQSRAYFIELARQLGYPNSTITEFTPRRYGRARFAERYAGLAWRYVWQLNLTEGQAAQGRNHLPFPVPPKEGDGGDYQLECTINKYKPAHTRVFFSYGV